MKILFSLVLLACSLLPLTYTLAGESDAKKSGDINLMVEFPNADEPITISDGKEGGKKGALHIMEQYVSRVFVFGSGLVSLVAILWIIVGGYEIMFAGAGSAEVTAGKEKITKALLGIVLIFLSALILHTINPGFFTYK